MQERRKTGRLARHERTFVEHASGKKETTLLDISIGGMRVQLDEELKVGTPLTLRASILPHAGAFFMAGTVTWVKKNDLGAYETGVRFNKVSTIPL
ncbi:MAG TPA: PilZ domain-containing protein [Candidatus Omnitrophota bacterium]|nr:PilZ domain-containing protein [Candidatus Omnitrophota bacterium]HQJ15381.1 PilZ domain-containing protein [Candidatus Omnitrophota bacterium]